MQTKLVNVHSTVCDSSSKGLLSYHECAAQNKIKLIVVLSR